MAWISVFDTVKDNPKTRRLAQELNINRHEAIGILVCLWMWGLDNANREGFVIDATAEDIADGVMSRGLSADKLLDGLVNSGWIDRIGSKLKLHDFDEWQEKWFRYKDQRDADAARKRMARANKRPLDSPQDSPLDSLPEIQPSQSQSQSHNNNQIDNVENTPPLPPDGACGEDIKHVPSDESSNAFDVFWMSYPKKVGKEAARKSWNRIRPNKELRSKITIAIDAAKHSAQWKRENGRFIPNPATWLNQGRWDDELEPGHGMSADYYHVEDGESL